MKKFQDYEEEIYKCSRCGLCQSVCPVYKATLNECAVSKGKFTILNGILKGDLAFTQKVKSYLDLCTGCNACKNFCPSDIDARDILIAAKNEFYKTCQVNFIYRIISSYFVFKKLLVCVGVFTFLYRLLGIDKLVNNLSFLFSRIPFLGRYILLYNSLVFSGHSKPSVFCSERDSYNNLKTAIFFEGCFNKYINPQTEDSVFKILSDAGIKLMKKNFECCGISFLSDGNFDEFKKIVAINISKIDSDYNYILTDCASCNSVLKMYKDFSSDKRAADLSAKTISVLDLIHNFKFVANNDFKLAVHVPCHETFDLTNFVKNIANATFIDVEDSSACCGFSGTFAIKNSEISRKISKSKAQKYYNSGVDFVITTCPACVLGLEQGFLDIESKNNTARPKVINLFNFLAGYCCIKNIDL